MGLSKAIASGKEHRIEYGTKGQPFAKAVDTHCQNHGGRYHSWECQWCKDNRTYKSNKLNQETKSKLEELE